MTLALLAPAKVNLVLEVLGRRPDGFHEIRSLVQTVSLYDRLQAQPADVLSLEAPESAGPLADNLVWRAAERLGRALGGRSGARLALDKRIPVAAGLGGGSSDAAAALRLLRDLWRVSSAPGRLVEVATDLGSDVPLFLAQPAMHLSGRGERVEWVPPLPPEARLLLVVPPLSLADKTPRVYRAVQPQDLTDGQRTAAVAALLRAGRPPSQRELFNGLAPAAQRAFPGLRAFQERLEALTSTEFMLAGAGPTLLRLLDTTDEAAPLTALAQSVGASVYLVRPLARLPEIASDSLGSQPPPVRTPRSGRPPRG